MANVLNFRTGQVELVRPAVDSGTVIDVGDMCYLATDDVRPASSFTWDTNGPTTKAAFADVFMGIAWQSSASGETDPIDVDISPESVYEFTIISATVEIFDQFSPDDASSLLVDQVLEKSSGSEIVSIARAVERHTAATTRCRVKFASAYNPSSNQAAGQLG